MRRRIAAILALVIGAATVALAVVVAVSEFPRGLVLLGLVLVAGASAWYGALRRGIARVAGLGVAALALAGTLVVLVVGGERFMDLLVVGGLLASLAASRAAFSVHVDLPRDPAAPPGAVLQPALRWREGGALQARRRGPRTRDRTDRARPPSWDLEALVRAALDRGADALAMAGGDGSQAIVAAIAAERALPYACVPAGTRNHFALDLGVDRETSSARSMRSWMAASASSTSPRSTGACSSTTSRSGSTPKRCSESNTRRQAADVARHRAGHARPRRP